VAWLGCFYFAKNHVVMWNVSRDNIKKYMQK
jgi:hypothetical protein